jgi:dihydrofolate reductase
VRQKDRDDAHLSDTIVDIWTMSRRSYGSPRVRAKPRLGQDMRCSRKRVERLMRQAGIADIHRRRLGGCTRRDLDAEPSDDLVQRAFDPTELKQEIRGEILVYASYQLVHALLEHDLVDELRLVIFPVVLGSGKRLFGATRPCAWSTRPPLVAA